MDLSNNRLPQVSIIIPTYQRAYLIRETIDSVLAQTYQDFEIIVIDDGSTDGTGELVAEYQNRVRYIYQENRGPASARNIGIQAAYGEFIAFQDSDDLWLPEKLALQMPLFARDPEIGMVYCDMSYFRFDGPSARPSSFISHAPPVSGYALREMFVNGTPMHTPTAIVRRHCFDRVGLFDEELLAFEDQDLWFRIAEVFKVDFIDEPLVRCRVNSGAGQDKDELLVAKAVRRRVLDASPSLIESLNREELRKGYYYQYVYRAAQAQLAAGETTLARQLLMECFTFNPLWLRVHVAWLGTFMPTLYMRGQRLRGNDINARFQDREHDDAAEQDSSEKITVLGDRPLE